MDFYKIYNFNIYINYFSDFLGKITSRAAEENQEKTKPNEKALKLRSLLNI